MNITYSFNYQKMMENIYKDARWEAYYDMVIIPLFNKCCEGKGVKIVPVHATRKSGRKPLVEKKHFIETYSWVKKVPNKKGEIEEKRVGIPDFVIDIVNIGLHFILKNVRPYAASCSEA